MTSLTEVNNTLKEQKPLLERTASGIEFLVNKAVEQSRSSLDELERQRENIRRTSNNTPSQTTNNMSGIGGILAAPLVGIGAALAGGGALLKGLGVAGAGIGAFFLELAAAEAIMSKFGNGENLKALLTNLAEGLGAFGKQEVLALGGLFAGATLFGAVAGVGGSFRGGFGIAAIGAGIAAFFAELSIADAAIARWGGDGSSLSIFMNNIADAISKLTGISASAFAGLFATGAVFGAVAGPATAGKATIGIAAIGAGIAAFFSALAAGDMTITSMEAYGIGLKTFITNLVDGISAFTPEALAIIGGLIATGGVFGPGMIGPAVGMGAIGAGIGLFFTGIGAGDAGISAINKLTGTQPGEGFKNLLVNTADGIEKFASIDVDPQKVNNLSSALTSISLAIVTFFGTDSIGKLKGIAEELAAGVGGVLDAIFGTNFAGEARKGAIERIIESLEPIKSLEQATIDKLRDFGLAITGLAESFTQLGNVRAEGMTVNLERMLRGVGAILDAKEKLLYGGSYRPPEGGLLGRQDIRFGEEGTGGLVNFSATEMMEMKRGIERLYSGLGISLNQPTAGNPPSVALTPATPSSIASNILQDLYVDNLTVREGLQTPNIIINAPTTNQNSGGASGPMSIGPGSPLNPVDVTNFLRQQALRQ